MGRPRSELGESRSSARTVRILRWLRRKPVLAKVIGDADDEGEVTCMVAGTSTTELHDVVSVVRDCTTLRGYDDKGNELRRLTLDSNDPELRAEREVAAAVSSSGNAQGSVPIISVDVPKLVDSIARNIREAVSEATRNNSNAHRGGFEAMVAVMNIALNLLVGIEQRYANAEEALAQRLREQQGGGAEDDPKKKLAMAALQQAMGGANGAGGGGLDAVKLMQFMQSMQGGGAATGDENGS